MNQEISGNPASHFHQLKWFCVIKAENCVKFFVFEIFERQLSIDFYNGMFWVWEVPLRCGGEQVCQMVYIFAYQKSQFGYILEGLGMENVGIFYGYFACFGVIWCIFSRFGMLYLHRKIWQPWLRTQSSFCCFRTQCEVLKKLQEPRLVLCMIEQMEVEKNKWTVLIM
jgi:hypothetical protein